MRQETCGYAYGEVGILTTTKRGSLISRRHHLQSQQLDPLDSARALHATRANSTPTRKNRRNTGSIRFTKTPGNCFPAPRPCLKYFKREPARESPERAAPCPASTSAASRTPFTTFPTTAARCRDAIPKSECSVSPPTAC